MTDDERDDPSTGSGTEGEGSGTDDERDDPSTGSGTDDERDDPSTGSGTEGEGSGTEGVGSGTEGGVPGAASVARRLEAILLVIEEPQSLVSLATAVGAPVPAVRQAMEALVEDYDGLAGGPRRGFELREVGGGWRLYVREEHDDLVSEFVNGQAPSKLSQAALETLAVIAYKQPVTRGQVASIRAVNVDSVVRTLLARGLITEVFSDPETGAIHYGTTDVLLVNLGINSLDELPHISPLLDDGANGFDEVLR